MSNDDMVAAITAAIQDQSKLQALVLYAVSNSLQEMGTSQLQAVCTALGIDYGQASS